MSTTISPSLLACDFLNIEDELTHFKECKDFWFHLDIMDGHFVPNLTFGHPIIKLIQKKTDQRLDAHLMVTNPDFYIDTLKDYGLYNLTWHYEASMESSLNFIKKAKKYYPSVGLSIKPKTKVEDLSLDILKEIDLLLIMSVEPGFGGQKFIEETYSRIDYFNLLKKENNLNFSIQIDGGVNSKNAQKLIEHGANNLVAGSYIFSNPTQEYVNKVESLRNFNE